MKPRSKIPQSGIIKGKRLSFYLRKLRLYSVYNLDPQIYMSFKVNILITRGGTERAERGIERH